MEAAPLNSTLRVLPSTTCGGGGTTGEEVSPWGHQMRGAGLASLGSTGQRADGFRVLFWALPPASPQAPGQTWNSGVFLQVEGLHEEQAALHRDGVVKHLSDPYASRRWGSLASGELSPDR